MSEFGYIPGAPEQTSFLNKGIFSPTDIYNLKQNNKWVKGGAGLELIEAKTVSGVSQIDFTSIRENEFDIHFVEYNIKPSADTQNYIRFSDDGGSSFETSNYIYSWFINDSASGSGEIKSTSSSQMYMNYGGGNGTYENHTAYYYFYNLGKSKFSLVSERAVTASSTGSVHTFLGGAGYRVASVINGIRFYPQNGTSTGTVKLFGIKELT